MTLAWLLPLVLILRAGLVMAQDLDSTNLGISMYMKGEISNEHLATITLTDSHSVQWGYNGWTRRRIRRRRRDGENAKFEHQIKNGIWELMRSNEHDPVGLFQKESVESVGNKNQKKAIPIPILANHNNKVKKSVKKPSSKLPRSPQLSSSSPSPSPSSDTITRKHKNSLSPRRVTKNATRLNETTTTDPTDTSNADCSPNLPDYCINQNCTAAKPNCLIVNGKAGCFPRTVEGWRLSSCPESLSYTGPYRKENETCELLTTPTDPLTLTTLLSVILNTTNATEGYSTGPLRDYGNCDPSLYCDSTSTPSVCRPKLATEMECESSNQCQSGRCLEKQGGTGPTVCLGVDGGNGDQPTSSSSDDDDDGGGDDGDGGDDDDDSNDSNVPVRGENLKLILTIVLPTSAGILIIVLIVVLAVRQRHRELRNYRRQVSYPKEILFQDGPQHTKWTNITRRPLTTIRESVIRFSRMTDTDDREEQNASAAQQQRRDSNRQSLLLPPPPKLTNSLMWMQAPHPLKPVYERIRALRSPTPPSQQQDDFGSAVQYPSGSVYTPTFASSSDSERIYQGYI